MSLTASTSLSTVLFLSSAFISWTISFSKRLFIEQAYADTIKRLLTPVKSISRHSLGDLSTDEVYKLRKEFFSNLFNQFPVSKTCKVIHVAGTKGTR